MAKKRRAFPQEGEFVIGTIKNATAHGAYTTLDEYTNKEGLIHISEISNSWVRNIRNHVREGQKVVVKVLRVDESKGHIDLSLRRVTDQMRKTTITQWKRSQKADKLLELAAKEIDKTKEDAYEAVGWPLVEKFGEIYAGLEEVSEKGSKVLEKASVDEEWIDTITELAEAHVTIRKVKISSIVELKSFAPNGVEVIKNALKKGLKSTRRRDVELDINLLGSPRYRVSVQANDYKIAEKVLDKAVTSTINAIVKEGGHGRLKEEA